MKEKGTTPCVTVSHSALDIELVNSIPRPSFFHCCIVATMLPITLTLPLSFKAAKTHKDAWGLMGLRRIKQECHAFRSAGYFCLFFGANYRKKT